MWLCCGLPNGRQSARAGWWCTTLRPRTWRVSATEPRRAGWPGRRRMSVPSEDDYDHLFKVVLVGDVSVGKTHLLSRYMKDALPKAPSATIGVEFATRTVRLPSAVAVKAQIWDTAGQERYRAITRAHYRRAAGAVLVYDVTRQMTFQNCAKWVEEVREGASQDTVIMLVGNKVDLAEQDPSTRQVYHDVAVEFARQQGLLFSEASAVTSQNVHQIFEQLLQEIHSRSPKSKHRPESVGGGGGGAGIQIAAKGKGGAGGATGCEGGGC
mmetsp:Transcript_47985/g.150194  ORF Transcript_47985/g.150194 Transcript_47985/m.150194 type:complete len:268 (-) Transcript_47985:7-810(-)